MASPTELDLFTRSLSGDRRARTEVYKKYFRDSSRVCRMGGAYDDLNDFLHDCFGNFLRTGYAWDKETGLAQWVETVAGWTSLINERQRNMNALAAKGAVRICAEIEGDDSNRREALNAYAPPLLGSEDSPSARMLALLNDAEKAVFRKRAMERGTWEDTAAALGKPLNTVGPIFARVVGKLARLFGAAPPMDDDLVPVFERGAADPQKPEGRSVSLQLDAAFYAMTPELQKIGVSTAYDARMVVLWETAASSAPPAGPLAKHLEKCHYCADLLRSMLLLERALLSAPGSEFKLCPGAFTLANAEDLVREAFDQHLTQCATCRDERTQVLEGQAPRAVPEGDEEGQPPQGAGKKIAWVVAAVLLLGALAFGGYRYFEANREAAAIQAAKALADKEGENQTPTVTVDPKYKDLVQNVPVDDGRVMASVKPENRPFVKYALDQFSLGQTDQALMIGSQLAAKHNDPGVQMVYAMSLYRGFLMTDGYREMLKSEAMTPRDEFRCWVMLQFALMVGDKKIMDREAEHLGVSPTYKVKTQEIMKKVRERG